MIRDSEGVLLVILREIPTESKVIRGSPQEPRRVPFV